MDSMVTSQKVNEGMPVGLIGDVHANLPALDAVLEHARQREVDAFWNVGDFVGYGAYPDEVVQRLMVESMLSIIGNYDLKVLDIKHKKEKWRRKRIPLKILAFEWAYQNLSKKSRKYLRALPEEIRFEWEGNKVLLTHASPASNEEALDINTPESRLRELAQMARVDLIICGHSHQAFVRQVDGVWFINTGSVGRPDDGDPRATYAIMQRCLDGISVEHFKLQYDVGRAVEAVRNKKLPEEFAQMLIRGVSLDTLLALEE
jgi:putative phosphoesterase